MVNTVVFTNPNAKSNVFDKTRVMTIERIVGSNGKVIRTQKAEDLEERISGLHKLNPESITVDGGDGTMLTFFTTFVKHWPKFKEFPPFAIIPGGTWNVMARHADISKRKWKEYLTGIIKSRKEDLSLQDIGLIRVRDNEWAETYGFSYGMGLPITLLEEYYTAKYLKEAKLAAMILHMVGSAMVDGEFYRKFAGKHAVKVSNGSGIEREASVLGLMAQSVPSVGLPKSHMFYQATHSERFHVLGAEIDIIELLIQSPALYLGKMHLLSKLGIIDLQTDHYKIRSEEPFRYQVNGDMSYLGKGLVANEVTLEHGKRIDVIKYLG